MISTFHRSDIRHRTAGWFYFRSADRIRKLIGVFLVSVCTSFPVGGISLVQLDFGGSEWKKGHVNDGGDIRTQVAQAFGEGET